MLISESSVSENLTHIWLPLAEQAARRIIDKLGLTEYLGNNIYINSDYSGSSVSWQDRVKRYAMLNEQKFHVNVKFNNNTKGLKWDTLTSGQHMDTMMHRRDTCRMIPLFYDKATGIHVIERQLPANIEMDCQLVLSDSVVAFDTVTAILNTFNRGELMEVSDFSYDYQLPLQILKDLWVLGQIKGIQPGHFMEWFKLCSNNAIQQIESKRLNNRHHEIVVKKQIHEALMSIDYNADQPAIKSTGSNAEAVVISFNVSLQFSRPNMIYLKYPIVIDNKVVPEELIHLADDDYQRDLYYLMHNPVTTYHNLYKFHKFSGMHVVHLPWYDNWTIPQYSQAGINESKPLFIAVMTFDDDVCKCCHKEVCTCECTAMYTTIDLYNDIAPLKICDRLKAWLLLNPEKALLADSIYSVQVFANDRQISPSLLQFDGRYLKIPNTLDKSKVYRVALLRTSQFKCGDYGSPSRHFSYTNTSDDIDALIAKLQRTYDTSETSTEVTKTYTDKSNDTTYKSKHVIDLNIVPAPDDDWNYEFSQENTNGQEMFDGSYSWLRNLDVYIDVNR